MTKKHSKLAAKEFDAAKFNQDTWNRYLMLGFVSAHIPLNTKSNLELRRSYKASRNELVLPSATTVSNICWMEYALPVDSIKKQLPAQNNISLTLDGWTSTNKLAITLVVADFMDQNWALREVQLAGDEVDCLFGSLFNC
jgi:hypothetical protein